jgi:radical SAM superfamily enzyme YgiQ (UPF0313 family)
MPVAPHDACRTSARDTWHVARRTSARGTSHLARGTWRASRRTSARRTPHAARGTWHVARGTSARRTWHVARRTWHVRTPHVARSTSHVARRTWHVARGTWHVARDTCHNTLVPRALLISTYDLGRQPFGLASPAAWLRDAGVEVVCADLAKEQLSEDAVRWASAIGFFLPMHTATRLALPVIDKVRAINPHARLVAYGLYAPLNTDLLRARGVADILGGEFENDLVNACLAEPNDQRRQRAGAPRVARLHFRVPDRGKLPPLAQYASLQVGGERRTAGYTEASRGCKHRCRHCPVVPVYNGLFRIVQHDVVMADIRAQVAAGARHITFGDPDFFNAVKHAVAIIESLALEFPAVTYDVTIKVEHLLRHADLIPVLVRTGCAFVTSAVESLDDEVLRKLEKGHTRADFEQAVEQCGTHSLTLVPTFVAFTPWTTLDSYLELLRTIDRMELVGHVAPIQLAIRLLIPEGSRMLELPDVRSRVRHYDPKSLSFIWDHADRRVDALQRGAERIVGASLHGDRSDIFNQIWALAHERAGAPAVRRLDPALPRAAIPFLNEPWYC